MHRYSLALGLMKQNYLLELSNTVFLDKIWNKRQIFKVDFLFLSLIIFIKWNRLLQILKLHLCLITNASDLNILKRAFSTTFDFVCAQSWIPGLLSNTNLVLKGSRFLFAEQTNKISITKVLSFAFFCCTENPAILPEMNAQLIPQFVLFENMNTSNFNHFIPLFIPKVKIRNIKNLKSNGWKMKQNFPEKVEILPNCKMLTTQAIIYIQKRYLRINTNLKCSFSNNILLTHKVWLLYLLLLYKK